MKKFCSPWALVRTSAWGTRGWRRTT